MPYLLASILAIVAAMVIMSTRYEADDSVIKEELASMKVMFSMVDSFVNTYIEAGESISTVNFEVLDTNGIILTNAVVIGDAKESVLTLPNSDVSWQLIPNINDSSSYKVLVNFTESFGLMSKTRFSESFIGREYCENALFGTFETNTNSYDADAEDFVNVDGTNTDGILTCVVFK